MLRLIHLETAPGDALVDVTAQVRGLVESSGVQAGLCSIIVPHTTAGITLNSALDRATLRDLLDELQRLVPKRVDFAHQYDTPADAAGHVKAALIGQSVHLAIADGDLLLGHSQSLLFYEFDGPRQRQLQVKIIAG